MTDRITILRPDDWHLHLRDGPMLAAVLPDTTQHFGRALIMPNLVPPVVTGAQAQAYHARILAALPEGADFEPLMTLYLTEDTVAADVVAAHKAGIITAVKLYPAGATTNSAAGVGDIEKVFNVLDAMAEAGVPLCVHGEVVDDKIDIFDREAVFINRVLERIRKSIPGLRVVMEHITTAEAAAYVSEGADDLAATITVHHLMINRNHMLVGGIKPHYYCLPVAKREVHREMLVKLATSGAPNVFLGTDSAPHLTTDKESACGCAGVFSAGVAMGCLAEVFDQAGALDQLEDFTSYNGAAFYGLPAPTQKITLVRGEAVDPAPALDTPNGTVTRFDPGSQVTWRVEG